MVTGRKVEHWVSDVKLNWVLHTFLCSSDLYFLGFNLRSKLYCKKQRIYGSSMVQSSQLLRYFSFYYSISYVFKWLLGFQFVSQEIPDITRWSFFNHFFNYRVTLSTTWLTTFDNRGKYRLLLTDWWTLLDEECQRPHVHCGQVLSLKGTPADRKRSWRLTTATSPAATAKHRGE